MPVVFEVRQEMLKKLCSKKSVDKLLTMKRYQFLCLVAHRAQGTMLSCTRVCP